MSLRHITQSTRHMAVMAKSLKFAKYGNPVKVLEIIEDKIDEPIDNQVLVKLMAAPINPSDIFTIKGIYPANPKFPAIGGNEFVGEVLRIGNNVKRLNVGQRVVAIDFGLGTWTTHALYNEDQLMPISSNLDLVNAATITVNPCTAYRMLKDFVHLAPGDCVIQNGANSAAGQAVHQLCKAWNIQSVGIVRDRPDIESLKSHLKCLGATEIFTEEEIRTSTIFTDGTLKKPKLALDCVGGKSASEVARHLDHKGKLVVYGGMSRDPIIATATALIFDNISIHGYWITPWTNEYRNSPEQKQMFDELCKLMEEGKFIAPVHEMVPLEQFKEAIVASVNFKGFTGKKYILNMDPALKTESITKSRL